MRKAYCNITKEIASLLSQIITWKYFWRPFSSLSWWWWWRGVKGVRGEGWGLRHGILCTFFRRWNEEAGTKITPFKITTEGGGGESMQRKTKSKMILPPPPHLHYFNNIMSPPLIEWMIDWMIDWLTVWLLDWLPEALTD